MSQFCVYIKLEPYLRQWFVHVNGGVEPVRLRRNSPEADLLALFLTKTPQGAMPMMPAPDAVAIELPYFRNKDPRVYNWLSPRARTAIAECLRVQFDVQLWQDLHTVGNIGREQKTLIYAWMEKYGIECTDTNWNTIAKKYQRKRKNSRKSFRQNTGGCLFCENSDKSENSDKTTDE